MINLIKFRRSGLWLLSFIAALLVLSPSAGAWDRYAIAGDNYNNWSPSSDNCKAFTNASGGFTGTSMTLTIDDWAGGNFRIFLRRDNSNNWDQYSISGSQQLVNGTTYNNLSQCGDGNDLSLPASATGKSVTFTLTTSQGNGDAPTSLKASWTDNGGSTQTYYLRGAFNSWTGTANQLTGTGNTRSVEVANWSNEKSGQDDGLKIVYNNNGSESWYGGSDITANGGSSDLSDKGGNINLPAAAEGETVTFTLTLNNNEPSSLSASWTDNGGGDDDDTNYPGLLGEWSGHNDWNNPDYTDWTKEGDWYVKTMTPASTSNIKFRIRYDDNGTVREYQPAANSVNTSVENGTEYSTWGRKTDEQHNSTFVINAVAGTTYKIYLNPAGGGKVKVTWTDNGGGNVEDPDQPIVEYSNDVQIFGDFSNISFTPYDGWQNWSSLQGTVKQNDNEYYYSFSPSRTGKVYFRFKVDGTNYQPTSANGSYKEVYCEENWDHDGARASSYTGDYINGSAYCWYVDVSSTDKVYTLHFRKDHSGYKRVTCTKADKPFAGRTLPVYPKGVTNKEGLNAYTGWPIYYLQASELNFERITPEYQMKKRADGKYELRVNMFDTQNVYVEKFTDATEKSKRYANRTFSLPNGIIKNAGRAYTAVYDPATKTLTFEDEGIEMPFLSMIGRDWKQNTVTNEDNPFKTPFALKDAGDYIQSYENKSRDTDYGWQEAWIQYSNNEILKDRKGNVMYTTMWPQSDANEVLFKTAFKVGETDYDFTLRGEQLTFVPQNNGVAKKGSEWKADARFSKVKNRVFRAISPA